MIVHVEKYLFSVNFSGSGQPAPSTRHMPAVLMQFPQLPYKHVLHALMKCRAAILPRSSFLTMQGTS